MISLEIEILGKRKEQDAIADSLTHVFKSYKNNADLPEMPVRSSKQDAIYSQEIAMAQCADLDKKSSATAVVMRKVHEASRTQRDFEILQAGRKKLMLSCLKAAYWRWEKLGKEAEEMEKSLEESK